MKTLILTGAAAAALGLLSAPIVLDVPAAAAAQPPAKAGASAPGPGGASPSSAVRPDAPWDDVAKAFGGVKADTKASRDVVMKFTVPTEVREILVKGGQEVKKGEVLVRARDADVVATLEVQRFTASNDAEVRGAEAQQELAKFRFERGKETKNLSPSELKELEIQEKSAGIQVEAARVRLETEKLKLKYYEGQYERYRLEAPFDGVISEVKVEVGQGATDQTEVLRLVNVDRLWLEAFPGTDETVVRGLKEGSPAYVLMDLPQRRGVVMGKVLYVNPVADSVTQTRQVRVEIPNPEHWPAGTPTVVRFSPPGSEWPSLAEAGVKGGSALAVQR